VMYLPPVVSYNCKQNPYRLHPCNWGEHLVVIYPLILNITLHNESCFVPNYIAILIMLQLEYPFQSNGVVTLR
jgi:hypothetical protein